jgi:hypothetical protein
MFTPTSSHRDNSNIATIFPLCLVSGFLLAGCFLRFGFTDSYCLELIGLSGFSFFVLLLPKIISYKTEIFKISTEGFISISIILTCALLSALLDTGFLYGSISTIGLLFFATHLFNLLRKVKKMCLSSVFEFLLYAFFTLYVISVIWGGPHLRPTFIETLVASKPFFLEQGFNNADTLYNLSIAQMLKHYNAPSTGLDGIPTIYYHYGSHWIASKISSFTGLHLVIVYNLGYPIILVPLFFKVFIEFALTIQQRCFHRQKIGFIFIFILMFIFIEIPSHLYSGGLLGTSGLVNDSFIISLTLLFVFLSSLVLFRENNLKSSLYFISIILLLIAATSLTKISTGFVLVCICGYLFLRFRLYRKTLCWLVMALIGMVFFGCLWITSENIPFGIRNFGMEGGTNEIFHFYKSTHAFEPFNWFVLFYLWLYAAVILTFWKIHVSNSKNYFEDLLLAEVPFLVASVGVVPSIFMAFNGGNSMYFSGIQLFVSGAVVLGFVPFIEEQIKKMFSKWKKVYLGTTAIVLSLGILSLMYVELRWDFNKMIKINVQTRREILGIPVDPDWRVKYDQSTFGIFSKPVHQAYDTIKFGKFVSALMEQEKNTSSSQLLFLNHQTLPTDFFRNIRCIETSFIGPAFSGHAMLDGLSYNCGIGMYGDGYYQHNFAGVPHPSQNQICDKAASKGFTQVVSFDYTKNQFQLIDCRPR